LLPKSTPLLEARQLHLFATMAWNCCHRLYERSESLLFVHRQRTYDQRGKAEEKSLAHRVDDGHTAAVLEPSFQELHALPRVVGQAIAH
jgi:hypothetical protein